MTNSMDRRGFLKAHEAQYNIVKVLDRGLNPDDSHKVHACLKANEYHLLPNSYGSLKKCHESDRQYQS